MFEDLWQVKISRNRLEIVDAQNNLSAIELDGITGIAIRTDDSGPIGSDDGESIFSFPMGARGESKSV